jgi:hypothetical protein
MSALARPSRSIRSTPPARTTNSPVRDVRGNVIQWRQPAAVPVDTSVPVPGEDGTPQTISGPTAYACVVLGFVGAALVFAGKWMGAL